jgi:hypothetical protein
MHISLVGPDLSPRSHSRVHIESGVTEAAPPPWWDAAIYPDAAPADASSDAGDASVDAGGSRDSAADQQTTFVFDGGVSEAAPPPWWDAAVFPDAAPADASSDGGDASVREGDAGPRRDAGSPFDSGGGSYVGSNPFSRSIR